jgi:hypothetical protein
VKQGGDVAGLSFLTAATSCAFFIRVFLALDSIAP